MDKNVSIVRVDTRHYRIIARDNWGLTREQMKGKHVHHRIPISRGGTNDPTNLYVCSGWFHKNVWHAEDSYNSLVIHAVQGGQKAYEEGKGIHGRTPEEMTEDGKKGGNSGGWQKSQDKKSGIFGDRSEWMDVYEECGRTQLAKMIEEDPDHQRKAGKLGGQAAKEKKAGYHDPEVRRRGGVTAGKIAVESGQLARARTPESILKGAIAGANSKWMDPDHPELGVHNAGVLARKQRALDYPSDKKNRVKVG
jgi:hypothetical protein